MKANLAVEHIQPKGLAKYALLKCSWDNFLLGCINCNSTKGDQDVLLDQYLLPDRDNTFAAYTYTLDGKVEPSPHLTVAQRQMALGTLALTGLDKSANTAIGENGQLKQSIDLPNGWKHFSLPKIVFKIWKLIRLLSCAVRSYERRWLSAFLVSG